MHLEWKPSVSSSALHAAEIVAEGGSLLSTPQIAELIANPANSIQEIADQSMIGAARFWHWLIGLSSEHANNIQLAERVMAKAVSAEQRTSHSVTKLASDINHLEKIFSDQFPNLAQELPLRCKPLQENWESYGPGLLREIGLLSEPSLLAKQAIVIPVLPVVGGHGGVLLQSNHVWIEAVLTNPNPLLPETLRLAWLLSQLESETPGHGELVASGRLPWIASLAMLPPVLFAAQSLDLSSFTREQLSHAIKLWHIPNPTEHDLTDKILSWWETYSSERPAWRIALLALDKMLR
jgi:hypothetical protein